MARTNFREVEPHSDVHELDIDWGHYGRLEKSDSYRVISVRRDSVLVGYNSFFLNHHVRYRQNIWAINDVLFLRPTERVGWAGVHVIRRSEEMVRAAGATKILYECQRHVMLGRRGGTLTDLLTRLGYDHTGDILTKVFDGRFVG